jgi:hypothetical protein
MNLGLHPDRQTHTAKGAAMRMRGLGWWRRRRELIQTLPVVLWKGRTLFTIHCVGTRGKGPHTLHVPEALLWQLVDPRQYYCPFHAADSWDPISAALP